ncbi:hypothetical protein KP509_19G066600 [Ceratopteris richardii]|nr:hypothetical protein KP509_19G066600 [Ceratopteris richardii]
MELSEHKLVINAIEPLDPNRKCFRMIGGVLVERTVGEVLPAVQRNKEGIQEVVSRLTEALAKKKKELADFEAKYNIKVRRADEVGSSKEEDRGRDSSSAAQGVLVASS